MMLKRNIRLSDLLDDSELFAEFHDASIHKLHIDYDIQSLSAELDLFVDNPDCNTPNKKERTRRGTLKLDGLMIWMIDWTIDSLLSAKIKPCKPLWLTYHDLLEKSPTETGKRIAATLDTDMFAWCLFFSNINSYAYCAAKEASFAWETT
jgi:hypothetical protein